MKFLPEGTVGDQEEMAQLDRQPILCCGPEAAEAPFVGQQWSERWDSAVDPQQEQLPDTHVQPPGGERQHQSPHLSAPLYEVDVKVPIHLCKQNPEQPDQNKVAHNSP